jgi:hypothetical protein
LEEQEVKEEWISFDQFLGVMKEIEKRMTKGKMQPNVDDIKPVLTSGQADELVIELDTKVIEFLRYAISLMKQALGGIQKEVR